MRTNFLWRLTGLSAVAATVLMMVGLAMAVNDIVNPRVDGAIGLPAGSETRADETGTDPDGHLDIVALGDSLTTGMGDNAGLGYVGRVKEKLAEAGDRPVRLLNNLAVNGYRTDQLLADLDKASVADAVRKADIILFTIGGNDLFRYIREEIDVLAETLTGEELRAAIPQPAERLGQIIDRLADIRPEALIVYVGLYNPFLDLDETRESSAAVAEWNNRASQYAYKHPNVLFVPVADLFERDPVRYLYSDHFHPNAEGYERMAERVFRALQ
jgi:lysophospholipase L1-like esterase